ILLSVQIMLRADGIPCIRAVDEELLHRTGTRTVLAYLRIALGVEPLNRMDLIDTIRRPSRKIRRASLEAFEQRPRWTLDEVLKTAKRWPDWEEDRLQEYVFDIRRLRKLARGGASTARLLQFIRDDIGLGAAMESLDESHSAPV